MDTGTVCQSGVRDWIRHIHRPVYPADHLLDHILQLFIRLKFIFPRMHDPGFLYEDMVPSIDHHLRDLRVI